ncbi:hypothetical protein GCM10027592_63300 [Spirosoma flavus]
MTSDANFEGKGDFTKSNEPNGSINEQTVISDPQTATSADQPTEETPATPEPLAPDVPNPSKPNASLDPEPGPDGQYLSVNLPSFLTRHFKDTEKYAGLQKAIRDVFRAYYDSTLSLRRDVMVDAAYRALEVSFSKVLEWGAVKTLGALPDKPVTVPADIEENAFQFEAYDVYMNNPYNYTDVTLLQEWIKKLQDMSLLMTKTINTYQRQDSLQERLIKELQESAAIKDTLLNRQERVIKKLEEHSGHINIPTRSGEDRVVPNPKGENLITYYLSTTAIRGRSEFDVVVDALQDARDTKLKEVLRKIVNDETDEAACDFEDYNTLKRKLDFLSGYACELSDTNYQAYLRQKDADWYAGWYTRAFEGNLDKQNKFMDAYSVRFSGEEESDELSETEEPEESEPTVEAEPEPIWLQGIADDIDRDLMLQFKKITLQKRPDITPEKLEAVLLDMRRSVIKDLPAEESTPQEPTNE